MDRVDLRAVLVQGWGLKGWGLALGLRGVGLGGESCLDFGDWLSRMFFWESWWIFSSGELIFSEIFSASSSKDLSASLSSAIFCARRLEEFWYQSGTTLSK